MRNVMEYEIVQNSAIASLAIWTFVIEYYKNSTQNKGPNIALSMILLPIIFNKNIVNSIYRRQLNGGIYKALIDNPSMFIGLQERMELMSDQTFKAINFAFAAELITYRKETGELIPLKYSLPNEIKSGETSSILSASKRLGFWCSSIPLEQLYSLLKVRF